MNNLNSKQISALTAGLEQLSSDLHEQIELAKPAASSVILDQSKIGRLSRMDAMQQQHMADSTLQHTKEKLKLVTKALNKISEDKYGFCVLCDEIITFARLQVSPEAQLCLRCQSQKEQ